ncbi:MAG TPA: hypothetical protein VGJ93_06355 [Desulfuromonadaceae bacterium]|jgi:hypothetical protein
MALASYAGKDFKNALSNVAECLSINEQFRPAITLQSILCDDSGDTYYTHCRARIMYPIYNRFDDYDNEVDGKRIEQYNAIMDDCCMTT